MTEKKDTLNNIAWFTALGFLRPAINIFLLPLYLVKITPEEYGILALVTAFSGIVASISGFKLEIAAKTFYFDFYKNRAALKNYLGQIFSIIFSIALILLCIFILSGPFLFDLIFKSDAITFWPYGIIAIGHVLFSSCNTIYFGYLKNELKVKEFVIISVIQILFTIALQAVLILQFNMGVLGILYGGMIPAAILFVYILLKNTWLINFKFEKAMLRPSFIFGLGFLPISFLLLIETQIDRLIIERYLSLEAVGLYFLLINLVRVFMILVAAYHNAITPILYKSLKSNNDKTNGVVNEILSSYTSIGIFALAGILVVGNHLYLITDNAKYLSIQQYFPYAIAATVPMIFIRFQILIILFYKKTFRMSVVTFIKAIVMILFMIYLIPKYEIYGAIMGLAISYIIYFTGLAFIEEKVKGIHINYSTPILRSVPFLLLLVLHLFLAQKIGGGMASIVVFSLTSIIIFLFEKEEIFNLLKTIKSDNQ